MKKREGVWVIQKKIERNERVQKEKVRKVEGCRKREKKKECKRSIRLLTESESESERKRKGERIAPFPVIIWRQHRRKLSATSSGAKIKKTASKDFGLKFDKTSADSDIAQQL